MLLKSKDKITKSYDVIVVGSGLAGMTAANKLARDGRSVLLLEAHNNLVDLLLGLEEVPVMVKNMSLISRFMGFHMEW